MLKQNATITDFQTEVNQTKLQFMEDYTNKGLKFKEKISSNDTLNDYLIVNAWVSVHISYFPQDHVLRKIMISTKVCQDISKLRESIIWSCTP